MENPKYTFYDKDNLLVIVQNMIIYTFDGNEWNNIIINDMNLPNSGFEFLKYPSLVELFNLNKSFAKVFMVSGGFNISNKSIAKTVFILNVNKGQCFLDFKFKDMNNNRYLHNSINLDNKYILVIGGRNEKDYLSSCEYLSLEKKEWIAFPNMLSPRANFSVGLLNNHKLLAFGGFNSVGKFSDKIIAYCDINYSDLSKSTWKELTLSYDKNIVKELPLIGSKLIPYENNFIICGGSNGEHLLSDIFELNCDAQFTIVNELKLNHLGKCLTPRSSYHYLIKDGDFYLIGGSEKKVELKDNNLLNYAEKFTFNLNNDIEGSNLETNKNNIALPLLNIGMKIDQINQEIGFPFSCSILTKNFK